MNLHLFLKRAHRDYVIRVLWIKGLTVADVAKTVGASAGAVRGVVTKGFVTPRSDMSLADRQRRLDEMLKQGPQGLDLPSGLFRAQPCEKLSDFARKQQKAAFENRGKFERVKDDSGRDIDVVKTISDGLQEAASKGWLYEAKTDGSAAGIAVLRFSAGQSLMRDFAMAMVSPVKEQSFEAGGTGGKAKNEIRDATIDATGRILVLQNRVHVPCWVLLCAVCRDGFHLGDYARLARKPERLIRRLFRRALDDVAVPYKLLDEREYRKRWGYRTRPKEVQRLVQNRLARIQRRLRAPQVQATRERI